MKQEDFSKYNGDGTTLRKAQLKMLEILVEVDKICRKHNIPYWLDSGTLLGAVRHGGFIPWDDDVDICVPYKDYLNLRKILPDELSENLYLQDWKNDKQLLFKLGKIRNKKTIYKEALNQNKENGLFIDILPMKYYASYNLRHFIDYFYGRAYRRIRGYNENTKEKIISYIIWVPINIMVFFSNIISTFVTHNKLAMPFGSTSFYCKRLKSDIFPLSTIAFEDKELFCPNNTDNYLKNIYGDYMTIPPESKREIHTTKVIFLDEDNYANTNNIK